ncbi:DUF3885 domain-containing protein [Streptomyces avermitilis]|uniref:DUF3885 domain-containing protein n=1 Tax=Streptomyces avermitilis TaxID=33903 RepID=UPI0033B81E70
MTGRDQAVDITGLDGAWNRSWPECPPEARRLRHRFPERWARFHALPEGKRYAASDAEHAEILRRHHALLENLLGDATVGDGGLVAITCSWSATGSPTPRDSTVAATTPRAAHWRSDDLATEPGFPSWWHFYVSAMDLRDPALDRLLLCVADDMTDGVILTEPACAWAVHPYDGGVDVFAESIGVRDELVSAYAAWLPSTLQGTNGSDSGS